MRFSSAMAARVLVGKRLPPFEAVQHDALEEIAEAHVLQTAGALRTFSNRFSRRTPVWTRSIMGGL